VESATPTETITATAMATNAQANFTQVNMGQNDGGLAAATNFYMDNLALSGTGLPGPAGAAAAAVVPELVMAPRIPSY
jgi:energy-converting hydrogenase Eha subunit B